MDGGLSFREAANLYEIPKSTLHSKMKNLSSVDAKKGSPTVLSKTEEDDIEKWIIYCAEQGFPVTKDIVCDQVQKFITSENRKTPFRNNRPGHRWFNGFMKRHTNLSKQIAQDLTVKRASVSESDLRLWFHDVESKMKDKGIPLTDPKRIFNLDESSFMLVPKESSVLAEKGAPVKRIVSNNEKGCLTVLFTASAEGVILPPMIMFDLKNVPKKEILEKIPESWGVAYSDNGWMTAETFFQFIANIFVPWLKKNNYQFPVILFVDNHASHVNLPLCKFCVENQVELVALYPNSTHIIAGLKQLMIQKEMKLKKKKQNYALN
ncbi:uncharacterized protein LOC143217495 [Lasioglossum baleicum]|uniref:uncharacterized protein LOC143217495 n=1 Tax=Lasioglossum baleicum TaxID=434251 RepID=UPI003FCD27CA